MTKSRLLQSHVPDQMRRIRTGRSLTLLTGDKVYKLYQYYQLYECVCLCVCVCVCVCVSVFVCVESSMY